MVPLNHRRSVPDLGYNFAYNLIPIKVIYDILSALIDLVLHERGLMDSIFIQQLSSYIFFPAEHLVRYSYLRGSLSMTCAKAQRLP